MSVSRLQLCEPIVCMRCPNYPASFVGDWRQLANPAYQPANLAATR
jgi:hypothetical protein